MTTQTIPEAVIISTRNLPSNSTFHIFDLWHPWLPHHIVEVRNDKNADEALATAKHYVEDIVFSRRPATAFEARNKTFEIAQTFARYAKQ